MITAFVTSITALKQCAVLPNLDSQIAPAMTRCAQRHIVFGLEAVTDASPDVDLVVVI
jgi:hypothetical protein